MCIAAQLLRLDIVGLQTQRCVKIVQRFLKVSKIEIELAAMA